MVSLKKAAGQKISKAKATAEQKGHKGSSRSIQGTTTSAVYYKILKDKVWPSVHDLKLKHTCVLQQVNDPKHNSKSSEWLMKHKTKPWEWPNKSPDLIPIEML